MARPSHSSRRVPSDLHETLRELFAKRPEQLIELLQLRFNLPSDRIVPIDAEQTDVRPKQLLPDAVLGCPSHDAPELVIIVEVHLEPHESKRRAWAQYAATAYGRYGCRVEVLVVTPYAKVARWAARPIRIGGHHTMTPVVLGPDALPLLDRDAIEAAPVHAMLSTLAHMHHPACPQHALDTLETLAGWDGDADGRLADILLAALTKALRQRMEKLMGTQRYEYQSDIARKFYAQGRAEAKGETLLLVLRSRGLEPTDDMLARIEHERDAERIDEWTRRAISATTLDDIFADE